MTIIDQCEICTHAAEHHWWGMIDGKNITHCKKCHRTWKLSQARQAHCATCCAHFSSPSAFDLHLRNGQTGPACRPPGECVTKDGAARLCADASGMWGRPATEGSPWAGRPIIPEVRDLVAEAEAGSASDWGDH